MLNSNKFVTPSLQAYQHQFAGFLFLNQAFAAAGRCTPGFLKLLWFMCWYVCIRVYVHPRGH